MKFEEIIYDCILKLRNLTKEDHLRVLSPTDQARVVISSSKTICSLLTLQLAYQEALSSYQGRKSATPNDAKESK